MNYRFTAEHKSLSENPSRWPLVAVDQNGYRNLEFEGMLHEIDGLLTIADSDAIIRLDLDPGGVEFLLGELEARGLGHDLFTQRLRYARDVARFKLWDKVADRA